MISINKESPKHLIPATSLLQPEEAGEQKKWQQMGFSEGDSAQMARCAEWTSTFPLQRVKKRKRVEAICPMVGPSMADRSLFFQAVALNNREPDDLTLDKVLRGAAQTFESRIEASDPRLRCLVLILPGVRGARLLEATDPSRKIKSELLRKGILAGEFFPSCPFATTFNRRLFALRSPAPMYVLRTFIESDWRFICQVPAWRETYHQTFGEPPAHLRHIGGPLWLLQQKIAWRLDKITHLLDRIRGNRTEA